MHVAMIHRKVNEGQLQEPVAFRFTFHSGAVTVAEEPLEDVPGFVTELPISQQLAIAIEEQGPLTAKELAEMTQLNLGSIQVTLSRERNFQRVGNNRWDSVK